MFDFLKRPRFSDATLGELIRSGSFWRSDLKINGNTVRLAISGPKSAPAPSALVAARNLGSTLILLGKEINQALFEHYLPYLEASPPSEHDASFPILSSPDEVPFQVTLLFATASDVTGTVELELGYMVSWDEEHTIGIRLSDGKIIEVCGSVIPV